MAKSVALLIIISSIAECLSGLFATALLFWSIEWLLVFQLLISIVPVLIACTLIEAPGFSGVDNSQTNTTDIIASEKNIETTQVLNVLFALKPLVLWIGATIIIFGLVGLYAFWLHQKYWELACIAVRFFWCVQLVRFRALPLRKLVRLEIQAVHTMSTGSRRFCRLDSG